MTAGRATASPAEVREVRRSLSAATDTQLRQIVVMVDEMVHRGSADALIEPLRGRLAQLRPPHKLRLERLLFMPLDPLIVAAPNWRPKSPTVPRNALLPIARLVRAALGGEAEPIDAMCAGKTTHDEEAAAGALLWPRAAAILADAGPPADWIDAGLKLAVFPPLAQGIAAVLARMTLLQSPLQDARNGLIAPREEAIAEIVDGMANEPAHTQAMLVTLLLARLPQAGPLLRRLESGARDNKERRALRAAASQATDALLERLEAGSGADNQLPGTTLEQAGLEIRRLAALLQELENRTATPQDRARLKTVTQRLDACSRARFAGGLADDLLLPLQCLDGPVDRSIQVQLETAARQLRAMETCARVIGSAPIYDDLLRQAGAVIQSIGTNVLSKIRAVRLVEILAGPDAAMALLASHP